MKFCIGILLALSIIAGPSSAQRDADTALRLEARRQTENIQRGGRHWPVLTTEYFQIHYQPTTIVDSVACHELDSFVDQTLKALDASGSTAEELRTQKLSYYLCDDETVERLTGYPTRGMADLAGRAVISSH